MNSSITNQTNLTLKPTINDIKPPCLKKHISEKITKKIIEARPS